VLNRVVPDAVLQRVVENGLVLRGAELGEDDGRLAHSGLACTPRCCRRRVGAGGRCIDSQSVEAVAVQRLADHGARPRVDVLAHLVQVQFPDELVGPGMRVDVEDEGCAACAVADRSALVAGRCPEIRARRQRRQVLAVLHAGPQDQDVGVRGVDGVGAGGHVADERRPGVLRVGCVVRVAQFVAERHAGDVGVLGGPFGYVREAALPGCGGELHVVEPGVAVGVRAAPLRFACVDVGADEYAFCGGEACDVGPDFEACCLCCPAGIASDDFVGDFCAAWGLVCGCGGLGEGGIPVHVA
jgi:hypothetical protein